MAKGKTKADLLQGTLDLLIPKALQRGPIHGFGITLPPPVQEPASVGLKGESESGQTRMS
jgi:hypothetical protein